MKEVFRRAAGHVSNLAGTAIVFLFAVLAVVVWGLTGPIFHYSDTWQLVINTGTTIVTFLMVFLIQNTQNRDSKAVQIKLDELIRATKGARVHYIGLEDMSDDDLTVLNTELRQIANRPGSAHALMRFHEKVIAEHTRRHNIHSLNPFHHEHLQSPIVDDIAATVHHTPSKNL